jgi:DNA-binding MarR family transcriptional regulator
MANKKRDLFEELINEVRMSQVATDRFDEAVAQALGINRTDMRCLDVLEREGGSVPAGRLAEATGLTSGAMTTAIDRLERGGFVRRMHDPHDRRRVLVELTPRAGSSAGDLYIEHANEAERLYRRYSEAQLETVLEFVRASRELNERRAAELEAENLRRGRPGA